MTQRLIPAATLLALTACAAPVEREREIRAPAIEAIGETVSCLQTSRIENTVVHDDFTIDFELAGGEVYRNTLPQRCFSLGFEERFAHSSTGGRLCNVDTITVLYADGTRGGSCPLGEFLPVRYVETD